MTRRRCCTVALVAGLALVTACGVPLDDEPRAITRTSLGSASETVTTETTSAAPDAVDVSVYFLDEGELEPRFLAVEAPATLQKALDLLVSGPPEDADVSTSIPTGTVVRRATLSKGVARIDLSDKINEIQSRSEKEAFAQMTFTAFDIEGVEKVRFSIEGTLVQAPTDDGNREDVTPANYRGTLNPN